MPFGVARPGLLLAADVDACGINFVVALRLEVVEAFGVVFEVGDAGAFGCVGAWWVLVDVFGVEGDWGYVPKVINPRMTRSLGFWAMRGILCLGFRCGYGVWRFDAVELFWRG